MSGAVTLQTQMTAAPACGGGEGFPSSIDNVTVDTNPPGAKGYGVKTGAMQAAVNAASYAALGGIGAGGPVTRANWLYLRSTTPMQVRLTLADASQPVLYTSGLLIVEATAGKEVTLVEVVGSGSLEYFASGAS